MKRIAADLRNAREDFRPGSGLRYDLLLAALNREGALERLLEAVQHDIETDMASGYLRETYKRLQENVSDER